MERPAGVSEWAWGTVRSAEEAASCTLFEPAPVCSARMEAARRRGKPAGGRVPTTARQHCGPAPTRLVWGTEEVGGGRRAPLARPRTLADDAVERRALALRARGLEAATLARRAVSQRGWGTAGAGYVYTRLPDAPWMGAHMDVWVDPITGAVGRA